MKFSEYARARKSIRGFTNEPLSKEVVDQIIETGKWSPSSFNSQTWKIYAVSGDPLDKIREGNTNNTLAGVPVKREFAYVEDYKNVHRQHQIDVAVQLFEVMDIGRHDKEKRMNWMLRGFRQFDAPVCVIITYDKELADSDDTAFDCGAVTTALVNAAWSRGLGAVINSQGIMQSPVVREHARIADDQVIMKAVALGWPDDSFPANAVVSERKSVEEATSFLGFED